MDICRVLYPNDTTYEGKVLRVRQQYFFVSASLQAMIDNYIEHHGSDLRGFAKYNSINSMTPTRFWPSGAASFAA